jgi:hypothetical protein
MPKHQNNELYKQYYDTIIADHENDKLNNTFKSCAASNVRGCITEYEYAAMNKSSDLYAGHIKDSTGNYKYKFITTNEMFPYKLDSDKKELFNKLQDEKNNKQTNINGIIANVRRMENSNLYNIEKYTDLSNVIATNGQKFSDLGLMSNFINYITTDKDGASNIKRELGQFSTPEDRNKAFTNNFENPVIELFSFFKNFVESYRAGAELIGYLRSQFFYNTKKKNTKIIMICMASPAKEESGYSNEYITIPTCRFAMQIADIGGNASLINCGTNEQRGGGSMNSLNEALRAAAVYQGGSAGTSANAFTDLMSDREDPSDTTIAYTGGESTPPQKKKIKRRVRKLLQKQSAIQSSRNNSSSESNVVDRRVSITSSRKNPEKNDRPLSQKQKALLSAAKHDKGNVVDTRVNPNLILKPIVISSKRKMTSTRDPANQTINPSEELQEVLFKKPKKLVKKKVRVEKTKNQKPKIAKPTTIEEEFDAIIVSDSDDSEQ